MTGFSCPCGFDDGWPKFAADWHRRHQAAHVAAFPNVDAGTRRNLAEFVAAAERREAS